MWCGVVWCGVVWCGVVWCGVVCCGVVWCGVVWCGVLWCGVVWCGAPRHAVWGREASSCTGYRADTPPHLTQALPGRRPTAGQSAHLRHRREPCPLQPLDPLLDPPHLLPTGRFDVPRGFAFLLLLPLLFRLPFGPVGCIRCRLNTREPTMSCNKTQARATAPARPAFEREERRGGVRDPRRCVQKAVEQSFSCMKIDSAPEALLVEPLGGGVISQRP